MLITSGIFPPEIGGPATYVHSFSNWLSKTNHEVTVVTSVKRDQPGKYAANVETIRRKGRVLWHLKAFIRIFVLLKNTDVVYANGLFLESSISAFLRRKKIVFRIPGDQVWERAVRKKWTDEQFSSFQDRKGNFYVELLRWIRKKYLNRASKIIVPSLFLAGVIQKWGINREKVKVVYNPYSPVEEKLFQIPERESMKFTVVTGGRLVPWKGIDTVIKVLKMIEEGFLIILGDGPERSNLENLIKNLGISHRVNFTGTVQRSELKSLFSKSDCFVLNSQYEGLPHIILEAMASGCPVVASGIGGIPEIIQHDENGILFEPDETSSLAASITKIKDDRGFAKKIAENGRKTIRESFNIDSLFQETEWILSNGINDHK